MEVPVMEAAATALRGGRGGTAHTRGAPGRLVAGTHWGWGWTWDGERQHLGWGVPPTPQRSLSLAHLQRGRFGGGLGEAGRR